MKNEQHNWCSIMRYCHFVLKIKPKDFWDMTILEILALSKESSVTTELVTKKDLEYLIRKFS